MGERGGEWGVVRCGGGEGNIAGCVCVCVQGRIQGGA